MAEIGLRSLYEDSAGLCLGDTVAIVKRERALLQSEPVELFACFVSIGISTRGDKAV